jgi:hypothetical protein
MLLRYFQCLSEVIKRPFRRVFLLVAGLIFFYQHDKKAGCLHQGVGGLGPFTHTPCKTLAPMTMNTNSGLALLHHVITALQGLYETACWHKEQKSKREKAQNEFQKLPCTQSTTTRWLAVSSISSQPRFQYNLIWSRPLKVVSERTKTSVFRLEIDANRLLDATQRATFPH